MISVGIVLIEFEEKKLENSALRKSVEICRFESSVQKSTWHQKPRTQQNANKRIIKNTISMGVHRKENLIL